MATPNPPANPYGIHLPTGFRFGEVKHGNNKPLPPPPSAPLGVLEHFALQDFQGPGFNTIFRPNNAAPTATSFPRPVFPLPPAPPNEAVLELNLTWDEINFSKQLGNVPNRGLDNQNDIELNGVTYLQVVKDITNYVTGKAEPPTPNTTVIHTETGFWLNVPETSNNPVLGNTLVRLGSIPHGTTINAQGPGPAVLTKGAPDISPRSITPFVIGNPSDSKKMKSQVVTDEDTSRLPQDLTPFIREGTITADILQNPVIPLTQINSQIRISETLTFTVSTQSASPETGGGTSNISFLVGAATQGPNAKAVQMESTFWIETVQAEITIDKAYKGETIEAKPDFKPTPGKAEPPLPTFTYNAPVDITKPTKIPVTYTQIQYAQMVFLDFNGLTWPHASIATLVSKSPIPVPVTASHALVNGSQGPADEVNE